jgi:hypothetical protein
MLNAALSSDIKSRLFYYSAIVPKDLTIFDGKTKNGFCDSHLPALLTGMAVFGEGGQFFWSPFPMVKKR